MICDMCSKYKATVHLTEIVNEQVSKLNLCEYCAKKKGTQMEQDFGIADLLQGLAEPGEKSLIPSTQKVKCSNCGMTFDEFKKIGRLGCGNCYQVFEEHIAPLLKRIHSSTQHTGKAPVLRSEKTSKKHISLAKAKSKPVKITLQDEVKILKQELKKAVANESYEDAAILRDKIKSTEAKINKKS